MANENELDQDELDTAQAAEQEALNKSQSDYFLKRVILLRAQLNRLTGEIASLRRENEELKASKADRPPE